ncbi:MAG: caspase family protein [Elusimicrobiota bacterium]|nr:caspase family protein [Elusimicrobiota bacterium]
MNRFRGAVIFAAALSAGCVTPPKPGDSVTAKLPDTRALSLCVTPDKLTPKSGQEMSVVMTRATARLWGKPGFFQQARFISGLDDAKACDAVMKIESRALSFTKRPVELYSAYTKRLLVGYEAHLDGGENDALDVAARYLAPGTPLYAQLLSEAGPTRAAQLGAAGGAAPAGGGAAITADELRRLMAEAAKPKQEEAAVALAQAPDANAPRYSSPEDATRFAVVIGVETYAALPEAKHAERDARAVYDHLVALGYPRRNISLLTGAQATRTGLVKNLEAWLPKNTDDKSTVFFYFSGHGAPDPVSGSAYLVPSDGDAQYLEETAYPVKRLYEKLSALKAKRVLVAMDACFSGMGGRSVLAPGTRPLVQKVDAGAVTGRLVALTASAENQVSGTLDEQRHGLFTYYLLKGLNGAAADGAGRVTAKSLHAYMTPRVQDEAKRANRDQTPQFLAHDAAADFVLR